MLPRWRKPDRVLEALGFQELIDVRWGESGIASKVAPQLLIPIAGDNRLVNAAPVIGAVNVAGAECTPLLQAAVENGPQRPPIRFTLRVPQLDRTPSDLTT